MACSLETLAALQPPGPESIRLLAADLGLRQVGGDAFRAAPAADRELVLVSARVAVGDEVFERSWAEGLLLGVDEAGALGLDDVAAEPQP